MKNVFTVDTHVAIMESGAAYFAGDKETARLGLQAVAQKLGELGVSSRQIDEERTRRAQEIIQRTHGASDATRELNRSYLLARDMIALNEEPVSPLESFYRYPREELLGTPALSIVHHEAA